MFCLNQLIALGALHVSLQQALTGYEHNQQQIPVYIQPAQGFESLRKPLVYYASDQHDNTKESLNKVPLVHIHIL